MYQHIDLMAAQSMAREREHELQATLREREAAARRSPAAPVRTESPLHHWLHEMLVRAHLVHAPIH